MAQGQRRLTVEIVVNAEEASSAKERCTLRPATAGGGAAFIIEKE